MCFALKVMEKRFKIYLFRHGRTFYNVKGIFTGHKNSRLTRRGKQDAKYIAKKLKNKKFEVAFYTSLSRSKETLDYVLKFHPECKKLIVDDRMIERNYGILEGIAHKSFIKEVGKQKYDLMVKSDAVENLDFQSRKRIEKFLGNEEYKAIHRGYYISVPGGESFADVERRVKNFISYLKIFIKKNKVNVAISAHGNSIRLFRKLMERASNEETTKWVIPYNKVFTYELKFKI